MKKLRWLVDSSLDGFMSRPNGALDWAAPNMDDEQWQYVNDLLRKTDTALFGRVTYQNFESYWPTVPDNAASPKNELDFSRWIDAAPKFAASKTLKTLPWKNSVLLGTTIEESVSGIKQQDGNDVLMFGSCQLASSLLRSRLIDEIHLRFHPVILGAGVPLFKGAIEQALKLADVRLFASGVVGVRYDL